MEEKYQLADALSIYDDLNGSLVVLQGKTGKICRMSNSSNLIHILDYLQRPSTFKGGGRKFSISNREVSASSFIPPNFLRCGGEVK